MQSLNATYIMDNRIKKVIENIFHGWIIIMLYPVFVIGCNLWLFAFQTIQFMFFCLSAPVSWSKFAFKKREKNWKVCQTTV